MLIFITLFGVDLIYKENLVTGKKQHEKRNTQHTTPKKKKGNNNVNFIRILDIFFRT